MEHIRMIDFIFVAVLSVWAVGLLTMELLADIKRNRWF